MSYFLYIWFKAHSGIRTHRLITPSPLTFQVQSDLKTSSNGSRTFHWSSSRSRVFPALKAVRYSHRGPYQMFQEFDVELRTRVKCVTAEEGKKK